MSEVEFGKILKSVRNCTAVAKASLHDTAALLAVTVRVCPATETFPQATVTVLVAAEVVVDAADEVAVVVAADDAVAAVEVAALLAVDVAVVIAADEVAAVEVAVEVPETPPSA